MKSTIFCIFLMMLFACNAEPEVGNPTYNGFRVYPNPVIEQLYISVDNNSNEPFTVVVFNTKGDVIFERNEALTEADYVVDLSSEPNGIYRAVLSRRESTISQRIFKR